MLLFVEISGLEVLMHEHANKPRSRVPIEYGNGRRPRKLFLATIPINVNKETKKTERKSESDNTFDVSTSSRTEKEINLRNLLSKSKQLLQNYCSRP